MCYLKYKKQQGTETNWPEKANNPSNKRMSRTSTNYFNTSITREYNLLTGHSLCSKDEFSNLVAC